MASVDSTGLREEIRQRAEAAFAAACDEMVVLARAESPVDTGETRDSVHVVITSAGPMFVGVLIVDTPQAGWTDEGTKDHVITAAEGGPPLTFEWMGHTVYLRWVDHPGSTKHVGWFSERTVGKWGDTMDGAWQRS